MPHYPLVFARPGLGLAALGCWGLLIVVLIGRRIAMARRCQVLVVMGAGLLAVGAGQPFWSGVARGTVAVMVDLSPSTRGATFRDRSALMDRIHQLVGEQPIQLIGFSDHNQPLPESLADLPCDQTRFDPPSADAVLLFSDGQFELPAFGPPTYPVIDPALDQPPDAAITDLKLVGHQVFADVRNTGLPRPLRWTGASGGNPAVAIGPGQITASLPPGDLWPENDSLSLVPPPPEHFQQWSVGSADSAAPAGWTRFSPDALPSGQADYLQPSVIVLSNISAEALSSIQQQQLLHFVRDLGGAIILVGGDHAFAAGGFDGAVLDDLSPLASSPPLPTMGWMLLIDSSGSMAGDGSIPTPWQIEIDAMMHLLPRLPDHDQVNIGSFAQNLSWWSAGRSAADTRGVPLPPAGVSPHGPTNLIAALNQIATGSDGSLPTQLLLMTDAQADTPDGHDLARQFAAKKIRLNLLAIGDGSALPALREISSATGGLVLQQLDARQWITAATLLLRSALPDRYQHRAVRIIDPPLAVSQWNRTWLKPGAIELERTTEAPMSAQWQLGLGKVISIAYPADIGHVQSLAAKVAAAPHDARFKVSWTSGPQLRVEVNAIDHDQYMNGEQFQLEISGSAPVAFNQTAPGQYRVTIPSPRVAELIAIRNGPTVIDRFAVAGRYPPEFDAIGNNRVQLQALAERTGGAVINRGPVKPIDFKWPIKDYPLTSEFAFAGFAVISAGLAWKRRS